MLKLALVYFAVVFGAGFVLGTIRILWLVPKVGVRTAELLEVPIMLGVSVLAARWIVRHFKVPAVRRIRLVIGSLALVILLAAETGLGLVLPAGPRDPVSGTAYFVALALFGFMPALLTSTPDA